MAGIHLKNKWKGKVSEGKHWGSGELKPSVPQNLPDILLFNAQPWLVWALNGVPDCMVGMAALGTSQISHRLTEGSSQFREALHKAMVVTVKAQK